MAQRRRTFEAARSRPIPQPADASPVECGFEENADLVGAIYILARGHRVLACGESVQSGRSVKQEPAEATQAIAA